MVGQIEMRVVDPDWTALPEGHVHDLLPVPGNKLQARLDMAQEILVTGRWSLEDHARAYVHVGTTSLKVKERSVKA